MDAAANERQLPRAHAAVLLAHGRVCGLHGALALVSTLGGTARAGPCARCLGGNVPSTDQPFRSVLVGVRGLGVLHRRLTRPLQK